MEEGERVALLSRRELRKQKLAEYLAAKGKPKDSNPKSSGLRGDSAPNKPLSSKAEVVSGKENETPADRFGRGQKKASSQLSVKPPRSVLGHRNRVNVKDGVQAGWRGTHFQRATSGSTKPDLKPVLKKTDTTLATSNPRSRLNAGVQASARYSSKSDCAAVPISASGFRRGSNAAWPCPMNTAGSRISLGCLVTTRTGLVPAFTQFLHTPSQSLARASAPATNTAASRGAAPDKSRHRTTSASATVSRRPAAAQKSLPPTALSKVARNKGVASAPAGDRKEKVQAKPNSRPSLLPLKSQITNGLKSASSTSSCTATLNKAKGTTRGTTSYQSDRRPTESSTRRMFEREGSKNTQQVSTSSRLSHQVAASGSRGFRRSAPAAAASTVTEKTSIRTNAKKGQSVVHSKPPQIELRRTVSSVTVPRPPRITNHTRPATATTATKTPATKPPATKTPATKPPATKTPATNPPATKTPATKPLATKTPAKAVPQTEGAKLTAAQEERMRKLKEWREAKGISYKRPPMQVKAQAKPPGPSGTDEVDSLISTLDRSLSDCIKLLEEGSPPEQVRPILSRLPDVSRKFTKFWICQARLMEREGNLDVLPMFKEAVGVVLEPLDELRTVVFEILKKKEELHVSSMNGEVAEEQSPGGQRSAEIINSLLMTPKPITALISGEKGSSSVVKYKVTTTPGRPLRQQQEPRRFNGQELRFLTPVRRSVRIHGASVHYPESLRDHDLCVASYEELLGEGGGEEEVEVGGAEEDTPLYIYVGNEALGDKVSVQLVSSAPAELANHCEGREGGALDIVRTDSFTTHF